MSGRRRGTFADLRARLAGGGVARRLTLVVVIPLVAVGLLALPVVAVQIGDARDASSVADEADEARTIERLLRQVQRERLVSIVYLGTPDMDRLPLITQQRAVSDQVSELAGSDSANLRRVASRVRPLLTAVRTRVLDRTVEPAVAHTVFSQTAAEGITALPVSRQSGSAAERAAGALGELIRANEEASRIGAALVVASAQPEPGAVVLADARTSLGIFTSRFVRLATDAQRRRLDLAQSSQAAQRINALAEGPTIVVPTQPQARAAAIGQTAAAAETYTALRRSVSDSIALEISHQTEDAATRAQLIAGLVAVLALLLIAAVAALSAVVARSVAVPLRRLTAAASEVATLTGRELSRVSDSDQEADAAPSLTAVPATGAGEIAELAGAFNQVQDSAGALLTRQVVTRRNIAAMFTGIARRTRNLADRQLALIDSLESSQQDPQLLDGLYRLDHVATRLRRTTSALLVIAGSTDAQADAPIRLADAIRAGAAEIEQFSRVKLGEVADAEVTTPLAADLILLLAELLDNAVNFSPPNSQVTVNAVPTSGGIAVSVIDNGIGMSDGDLAQENQRLVERERLDIVPTQVLGLFVVGRLARRHGMSVWLTGTEPQGVTAHLLVPSTLLTRKDNDPVSGPPRGAPALPAGSGGGAPYGVPVPDVFGYDFPPSYDYPPTSAPPAAPSVPDALPVVARTSVPAVSLPDRAYLAIAAARADGPFGWFGSEPLFAEPADRPALIPPRPSVDPAYAAESEVQPPASSALFRRVPGTHLAESARMDRPAEDAPPPAGQDPALSRAEIEAFQAGFLAAAHPTGRIDPDDDEPAGPPSFFEPTTPQHELTVRPSRTIPTQPATGGHSYPQRTPRTPQFDGRTDPENWQPRQDRPTPASRTDQPASAFGGEPPTPAFRADEPAGSRTGGLTRRVPGAHLPDAARDEVAAGSDTGAGSPTGVDPQVARAEALAFGTGFGQEPARQEPPRRVDPYEQPPFGANRTTMPPDTRPAGAAGPPPAASPPPLPNRPPAGERPGGDGLERRIPGANLAAALRFDEVPGSGATPHGQQRDPAADQTVINAFVTGFHRGASDSDAADQPNHP